MKPGDKVVVVIEGTVRQVGRHTGICFEVVLSKEHYGGERVVWVDSTEIDETSRYLPPLHPLHVTISEGMEPKLDQALRDLKPWHG